MYLFDLNYFDIFLLGFPYLPLQKRMPLNFNYFFILFLTINNTIVFPVTKISHKMELYIVYQEKPLSFQFPVKSQWKNGESPLKHHWKWILMQMSFHQLNNAIFQCLVNVNVMVYKNALNPYWKPIGFQLIFILLPYTSLS